MPNRKTLRRVGIVVGSVFLGLLAGFFWISFAAMSAIIPLMTMPGYWFFVAASAAIAMVFLCLIDSLAVAWAKA